MDQRGRPAPRVGRGRRSHRLAVGFDKAGSKFYFAASVGGAPTSVASADLPSVENIEYDELRFRGVDEVCELRWMGAEINNDTTVSLDLMAESFSDLEWRDE